MSSLKTLYLVLILTSAACAVLALPPVGTPTKDRSASTQILDSRSYIDANKLLGFVTNFGNLFYDAGRYFGKNDGLYYPFQNVDDILSGYNTTTAIFDAGIWMAGKVNGQVRGAIAEYSTEFVPGPMKNGTFQTDKPEYRVYKLYADSLWRNPNQDYLDYLQYAMPIGAAAPYVITHAGDTVKNFSGDQMLWSVFNDADPYAHDNNVGSTLPLGVEVRQTVWATRDSGVDSVVTPRTYDAISTSPTLKVRAYVVDPAAITGHSYMVAVRLDPLQGGLWKLVDVTTGQTLLDNQKNFTGGGALPTVDGMIVKVTGPLAAAITSFETVANALGPLDPPQAAAAGFAHFPTPLDQWGNPTDPDALWQQTTGQRWLIHTADNGGSGGGGRRGDYSAFISRTTRDGANWFRILPYDYEMRFTGSNAIPGVGGSYAYEAYGDGNTIWVPFELWNIGIGTPDDPSDDYQMIPWVLDDAGANFSGDNKFALESWGDTINGSGDLEHSVSEGIDDPFTDWIYWERPANTTPGTAGYNAAKTQMLAGTYTGENETEVMARMVLVAWDGGSAPPFAVTAPEQGTVFRITTDKSFGPDTATFVATIPTVTPIDRGGTAIVTRYDLYNSGSNAISDYYVSMWLDPDLGEAGNDLVGCDTTQSVFFCYNSGIDNMYGAAGPAVGLRLLQGPAVPSANDTAFMFGEARPGFRNMPVSAFSKYINGTDPQSITQAYNYMQGLRGDGTPYMYNGHAIKYMHSGDPVAGTGDIDVSPADRRMMVSVGPFNFLPGDSQQIIVKWGVGQGADALSSIPALKTVLTSAPQAGVTPSHVTFVAERDSQLPEAQIVRVMGFGGPVPSWSASSSQSWLQIDQTPDGVSAQLATTSLPEGMYYDTIIVSCSLFTGGEKVIPVQYQVVTNLPGCCVGTGGNVDVTGIIDLSDLSLMVAYLTEMPPPTLPCPDEANVNGRGIVDLSDLSLLVAYLTSTPRPALAPCP